MRVLTGIQPSGTLHWGNYFGAMKSMFDLQAKGEDMFMFIANFHAMTTVRDGATLSWSFADPKTIETIRLTAYGYNHLYKYDKILVVSVEVLQDGEWNPIGGSVAFNGPDSYGSDQSLYASLADEVTGHLATNVTGLRITFGNPKALGKCRYAEIEASGYDSSGGPTETVETPAFDPSSCSFFPSTNVALSCATADATIRYTLDGSAPTASSTQYTSRPTTSRSRRARTARSRRRRRTTSLRARS